MRKDYTEIIMETYRELYKAAKPSADFDELIKTGEAKKKDFFMRYYLNEEKLESIIEKVSKKYKLSSTERAGLGIEICLGSAPTSALEAWKKARKHGKN